MEIVEISSAATYQDALIALLQDCVDSGASVGFLPPLTTEESARYWQGVAAELAAGHRKLWLALEQQQLVGAVQLALCGKANGRHRGEVEKLMVLQTARGQGVGRALMKAMEQGAREANRSLLVLDTRAGDVASHLYRQLGYQEAGQIPHFALGANGKLAATVIFYKTL
ncbi:GNAT family N-acetyltransferase [Aeromonas allosaccharophila]|uniref:GNAT family N-acetyltransferase n=1 Tax=Aeromonas allosaccharophila TaxID=656 RepID=UPI001F385F04|nr:GNAT family N-acetyltransferase [Aeromonas allosaccharophila]MCE9846790.1 GNAT family N-acetyltransferase [Aeromonas allosaccharophila]